MGGTVGVAGLAGCSGSSGPRWEADAKRWVVWLQRVHRPVRKFASDRVTPKTRDVRPSRLLQPTVLADSDTTGCIDCALRTAPASSKLPILTLQNGRVNVTRDAGRWEGFVRRTYNVLPLDAVFQEMP